MDRRTKNGQWYTADEKGEILWEVRQGAVLAVLMDIRDELQAMNRIVGCQNTIDIPNILRDIRKNTERKAKRSRK